MFDQLSFVSEGFVTIFTFVRLVFFMNVFLVVFQIPLVCGHIVTQFTFQSFVFFMNIIDMPPKVIKVTEFLVTNGAIWCLAWCMFNVDMSSQNAPAFKSFVTMIALCNFDGDSMFILFVFLQVDVIQSTNVTYKSNHVMNL